MIMDPLHPAVLNALSRAINSPNSTQPVAQPYASAAIQVVDPNDPTSLANATLAAHSALSAFGTPATATSTPTLPTMPSYTFSTMQPATTPASGSPLFPAAGGTVPTVTPQTPTAVKKARVAATKYNPYAPYGYKVPFKVPEGLKPVIFGNVWRPSPGDKLEKMGPIPGTMWTTSGLLVNDSGSADPGGIVEGPGHNKNLPPRVGSVVVKDPNKGPGHTGWINTTTGLPSPPPKSKSPDLSGIVPPKAVYGGIFAPPPAVPATTKPSTKTKQPPAKDPPPSGPGVDAGKAPGKIIINGIDYTKQYNATVGPYRAAFNKELALQNALQGPNYSGMNAKSQQNARANIQIQVNSILDQQNADRKAGRQNAAVTTTTANNQAEAIFAASRAAAQLIAGYAPAVENAYDQAQQSTAALAGGFAGAMANQGQGDAQTVANLVNSATAGSYSPTAAGGQNVQTNPLGIGAAAYESQGMIPALNITQQGLNALQNTTQNIPREFTGYGLAQGQGVLAAGRTTAAQQIQAGEQAAQALQPQIANAWARLPTLAQDYLTQYENQANATYNAKAKAIAAGVTADANALSNAGKNAISLFGIENTASNNKATQIVNWQKVVNTYMNNYNDAKIKSYDSATKRSLANTAQLNAATNLYKAQHPASADPSAAIRKWVSDNINQKAGKPLSTGQPGTPTGIVYTDLRRAAQALMLAFPGVFLSEKDAALYLSTAQIQPAQSINPKTGDPQNAAHPFTYQFNQYYGPGSQPLAVPPGLTSTLG
jgi:hypothetical protein